jgi:hypothetical protein
MSHWDRRNALELADAIQNKINHPDTAPPLKDALIPIAASSTKASLTIQTPAGAVDLLRAQLCAVCRDKSLYPCDKAAGWSTQCAFVGANSK